MLNHITIMGRLTRDPELRRTGSGVAVASFTVAVDRDFASKDGGERETDFIDCVAWRQTGEFVSKYFRKGAMIVAAGRLQIRNWQDKEGNKRRSAEVIVENAYFGEGKRDGNNAQNSYQQPAAAGYSAPGYQQPAAPGYPAPAASGYPAPGGQQPSAPAYGGYPAYSAPAGAPASDFAMLADDDAQLPF